MRTTRGVAMAILSFAVVTASASAQLQFFPLGDLPGGVTNSAAYGVSADGGTVVGSAVSTSGVVAFKWTEGGGLVELPVLPGGTGAIAYAASSDGGVIVGGTYSATGQQACSWTSGGVSGLGDLAGGAFDSMANDVSDNGSVMVGYGTSDSGHEAFRWTNGTMTGLGDLAGGSFQSEAFAVTPNGAEVTGYGTPSGQNIFTWTSGGGMQDYYSGAVARDLSSDGGVVVGYAKATWVAPGGVFTYNYRRAARWNSGTPSIIGPESSGNTSIDSLFYSVTPDSSLAVGSINHGSGFHAVSHDSFNGVRDLRDVLVTNGVDMTGWTLTAATAISADGSVVVGYGTNPAGQQEAWVIKGYGLNRILRWVGNNSHWPTNGALTAADDLWMNIDSKDQDVGVTGAVVYSADKGVTWTNGSLTEGTPGPDYDHWYQNLGKFPSGTTIRYSLAVQDADGYQLWDNNQGKDYYAVVAPGYTGPVAWIGNDALNGTVAHAVTNVALQAAPTLSLTGLQHNVSYLLARDIQPGYVYQLEVGGSLDSFAGAMSLQPTGTNVPVAVSNAAEVGFFRMTAAATSKYVVITREVWPQDSAKAARLGYRIDGGSWSATEMRYTGPVGNNDVWQRSIGPVNSGATIDYFIEAISAVGGGLSHYDNNNNTNYSLTVP